jgi:hypothetical protein
VVVSLAVRRVRDHVEGRCGEGGAAGSADEAFFVVATGKAAVGGGNGFADDGLAASFAVAFGGCGTLLGGSPHGWGIEWLGGDVFGLRGTAHWWEIDLLR